MSTKIFKLKKFLGSALLMSVFLGCAHLSEVSRYSHSEQAKVWLEQMAMIEVVDVSVKDSQLFLKYKALLENSDQHKEFYAFASWDDLSGLKPDQARSLLLTLKFLSEKEWEDQSKKTGPIVSISRNNWEEIKNYIGIAITPDQENFGNVIRSDEEELLFFYDTDKVINVVDVSDKPIDIRINKIYDQVELADIIISSLEDYLKSGEIEADKILIVTKNDDEFKVPFIYVDFKERFMASLKVNDNDRLNKQNNVVKKGIKTVDQMIFESHVFGVVNRPFSSAFKLFSWGKGTVSDVMDITKIKKFESKAFPPIKNEQELDMEDFNKKLDVLIGSTSNYGKMEFLIGGDDYFPRLIEALLDAKQSIHLRTFIFDNDDYAVKIADVLRKKSKEKGVSVKVLLDGMGQVMGEGKTPADLPKGFRMPASMEKYLMKDSNVEVRVGTNVWLKADHTKTITIDGKVCFTGGMNIGREYRYHWHDLMVELTGPIIDEILYEFNIAWENSSKMGDLGLMKGLFSSKRDTKKIIDAGENYPIRTLYTRINDPQIYKAQLAAIRKARKYIYINNAYFSDNTILYELIRARRRGVDVRVILPVNGNHEIMNSSNIITANIMFKNGIKVYFYPGMSHVKAAIYDGWLCTGSANFDKLSFRYNLEFNLATAHKETVERFKTMLFDPDFKRSKVMDRLLKSNLKDFVSEILAEQL
ncbi:MAG: phosphatidylserine/phosphatidylglycerophosphate/cardiolipin synthase family protein [Candidatus Omnitrophica bacterium]|nr:phosphatidylserine/phosphatidylglycerophosphate/cardiolipin synthase family protein [Candidatus Omnitrophota bacterium]MBU1996859.1 phosphatidylserine/phosphatidylglycerophosphate/cardiolipin synthase family protein [Candidatus Omnitrophota bacterium]